MIYAIHVGPRYRPWHINLTLYRDAEIGTVQITGLMYSIDQDYIMLGIVSSHSAALLSAELACRAAIPVSKSAQVHPHPSNARFSDRVLFTGKCRSS